MIGRKITFGLVVGTRGCFNYELAVADRDRLVAQIRGLGHDCLFLGGGDTPTGCVEGRADGVKCAALFNRNRDGIDGIIIALPSFGDEMGVIAAVDGAKLDVPILLQASDDELDKLGTRQRRDSFCGKLSVANNLWQYGYKFSETTSHTCDVGGEEFRADIDNFARVCRVYRGLRNARIGAIGCRPPDFQTMRISEKLLQTYGITVVPDDLSDIVGETSRLGDRDGEVVAARERLAAYGDVSPEASEAQLLRQAKLTVAVERWIAANEVHAAGIQCWTSLQRNYGCAACATMSMISDRLVPCACESDVGGAISMYALSLAAGTPSSLLDWNNNYGRERNKCVCTHCGNYSREFTFGPGTTEKQEISYLDVLGTTLGKENCFGAVKAKVKAGDMTFFRISTDDRKGEIRAYLGQGRFTDDPFAMSGGIAVCEVDNLREFMRHIVANGFEHHVGMVRGHYAGVVEDVAANYLGWNLYRHM